MASVETPTHVHNYAPLGMAPTWGSVAPGRVEKCRPPQPKSSTPGRVEQCRPPKPRVKAKSSLLRRNYFITMHHQAGVNFENFTEVKFRDTLLTGTGHRDGRLNRDSPDQTGTYGRSNLKPKSNFKFIRERPFAIPSFHQKCLPPEKCRPGALPPDPLLVGALPLGVPLSLSFKNECWKRVQRNRGYLEIRFCYRTCAFEIKIFQARL